MIDDRQLAVALEAIAVEVAGEAADHVAANRPDFRSVGRKTSATDLVTDVDRATEALIVRALRARRPGDVIVGEEGGTHRAGDGSAGEHRDAVHWVVVPIDGTVNFVLGLPAFSVSIAARRAGITLAGCVLDVSRREVFHASVGGGSWLSGPGRPAERLTGPRPIILAEAVVGTGFAYSAAVRTRQGEVLAGLLGRVGNVRRLGSAALDLCYVGAGRLDAYFEAGLNDWDRAAGMLVAAEAGAGVATISGPVGEVTLAAGAELLGEFEALLRSLGAESVLDVGDVDRT